MRDLVKLVEGIHAYIGEAIAPIATQLRALAAKVDEIASRAPEKGADGKDGKDGASVTIDDVAPLIAEEVGKAVSAIPVPQNGKDGKDGKDGTSVTLEDVVPIITGEIGKAISSIPVPRDGKDGKDGVTPDPENFAGILRGWFDDKWKELSPRELLLDEVAAIPRPENGKDGKDGKDGLDGKSVTVDDLSERMELVVAKWALEFERRSHDRIAEIERQAQAAIEKATASIPTPRDGKDGVDGLSFEDLSIEYDGERKFVLVASRGEREIRKEISLPVVLDRGFWQRGTTYEAGDGVTCGGDYWIAKRQTETQPDALGEDWRRAVRKGRNARGADLDPQPSKSTVVRLGDN